MNDPMQSNPSNRPHRPRFHPGDALNVSDELTMTEHHLENVTVPMLLETHADMTNPRYFPHLIESLTDNAMNNLVPRIRNLIATDDFDTSDLLYLVLQLKLNDLLIDLTLDHTN